MKIKLIVAPLVINQDAHTVEEIKIIVINVLFLEQTLLYVIVKMDILNHQLDVQAAILVVLFVQGLK